MEVNIFLGISYEKIKMTGETRRMTVKDILA
jgi:hypothetical protein